jgi:hypothetical protein
MSQSFPEQKPSTHFGPGNPPPSRSYTGCLLGCVVFGVACLLICGGVAYYVTTHVRGWAIDFAANVGKSMVDGSELRAADKTEVKKQIDRVATGFKQGKITQEEAEKLVEGLTQSPLFSVLIIYGVEQQYLSKPDLDPEEKAKAERTLQRIARGSVEGKITTSDLQGPLSHVTQDTQNNPGEPPQPKQEVSEEDLKKCLEELLKLADDKGIPDEPYELNVGAEVKRIVDEAVPGKLP